MLDWAKTIIQAIGYPGIALLMVIENIFPPIPSEVIMPFAGFVSEQGDLSLVGVIISGTLGSVLGTAPFYFIGYKIGEKRIHKWVSRHGHWLFLTSKDIKRAQGWFERYDTFAVLLGRLIPGVRTLISIPAGIERMNFGYFIFLSLLGSGLWVGILAYLGSVLGRHYNKVEHYLGPVSYLVIGGLILWYAWHIIKRYFQSA